MTNLFLDEYKVKIQREYRMRFYAVISLFIFFALGISIVALLPGALSVGADYLAVRKAIPQQTSDEEEKLKELNASLQTFREALLVLDPEKTGDPLLASELIRLVVMQKPEKVSLGSFSFITESDTVKKLALSGVARDRESLVSFSKRLSENKTFSNVNFPISNLSKREDIEFSVTITVVQEKKEEVETEEGKEGVEEGL